MPELRIVLAGYGTVGKALHAILEQDRDRLAAAGIDLKLVAIARREQMMVDANGISLEAARGAWKPGDVIEAMGAVDADVLVEATPTDLQRGQPALGHCKAAFRDGLHVVLANKGPVVVAHQELLAAAKAAGVRVLFEAAVGACIPVLNAHRTALAADEVERVEGILNGTTNFILSRMAMEGSDLDQALREAQALGYAEADPTNDLDGWDAAAKIAILANSLLGRTVSLDDVEVQGIRGISRQAMELATANGYAIRLVAEAARQGPVRVAPRLVARGDPLDVAGVLNAVRFTTRLAGRLTHIGPGAGGRETAAAILADLAALAKDA